MSEASDEIVGHCLLGWQNHSAGGFQLDTIDPAVQGLSGARRHLFFNGCDKIVFKLRGDGANHSILVSAVDVAREGAVGVWTLQCGEAGKIVISAQAVQIVKR